MKEINSNNKSMYLGVSEERIEPRSLVHLCDSRSVVSDPLRAPWTVAYQAPLSVGFSRQEYWSGLPFPAPEDLSNPRIQPSSLASPALANGFFTS